MSLAIDDPETEALLRRLAKRTGKSPHALIREALEERFGQMDKALMDKVLMDKAFTDTTEGRHRRPGDLLSRLAPLLAAFARARRDDTRSDEEIIGYDEWGLPS